VGASPTMVAPVPSAASCRMTSEVATPTRTRRFLRPVSAASARQVRRMSSPARIAAVASSKRGNRRTLCRRHPRASPARRRPGRARTYRSAPERRKSDPESLRDPNGQRAWSIRSGHSRGPRLRGARQMGSDRGCRPEQRPWRRSRCHPSVRPALGIDPILPARLVCS
jgi:hypothetical protein